MSLVTKSYQHNQLLHLNEVALNLATESVYNNDRKAAGILSAGSIALGVLGLLASNSTLYSNSAGDAWGTGIAVVAFIGLAVLYLVEQQPLRFGIPLSVKWEDQYTYYLDLSEEECFTQILSNYVSARQDQQKLNHRKAALVAWMLGALVVELVGLLIMLGA